MSDSFATPQTVACQVPLSMGFSRQEFWSGLPYPSPGDLPDPGMKLLSYLLHWQVDAFSRGNYTQYYVITFKGKESGKVFIHSFTVSDVTVLYT